MVAQFRQLSTFMICVSVMKMVIRNSDPPQCRFIISRMIQQQQNVGKHLHQQVSMTSVFSSVSITCPFYTAFQSIYTIVTTNFFRCIILLVNALFCKVPFLTQINGKKGEMYCLVVMIFKTKKELKEKTELSSLMF